MKKLRSLLSIGIMSVVLSTSVFAAGKLPKSALDQNVNIYINNSLQSIPEDMGRAYLDKNTDRVMVPIRYISENLGAKINFYKKNQSNTRGILIGAIDVLVELDIDSTKAKVNKNGQESIVNLDSAAILCDGRTYVPIRFISETLGLDVEWKNDSVYISGSFKTKGARYGHEENSVESSGDSKIKNNDKNKVSNKLEKIEEKNNKDNSNSLFD